MEQLGPQASPRGVCILWTANVETALDRAIQSALSLAADSRLIDDEDLFSAFAQKIELGHALKIYGTLTKGNLTVMRHLRNAFAHAKIPLTFETPEVVDVCKLFQLMPVLPPHVVGERKANLAPRELFEEIAMILSHNLVWWSIEPVQGIDSNALKPEVKHNPAWEIYRRKPPLA